MSPASGGSRPQVLPAQPADPATRSVYPNSMFAQQNAFCYNLYPSERRASDRSHRAQHTTDGPPLALAGLTRWAGRHSAEGKKTRYALRKGATA